MVVILLGPPGVGKGTQAVRLADALGWTHVSTGDLLRAARREGTELGRKAEGYMEAGELVPDDLILDMVRDHLRQLPTGTGILFDGFPRTTAQADGLSGVLRDVSRCVGKVVVFDAPDEVVVRRLSGRRSCPECGAVYNVHDSPPSTDGVCDRCGGSLVHRVDDDADTVRRRLHVYQEQTAPLVAWYEASEAEVVHVGADRAVEEIHGDLRRMVAA